MLLCTVMKIEVKNNVKITCYAKQLWSALINFNVIQHNIADSSHTTGTRLRHAI